MRDPFKPTSPPMVKIANAALPILLDRLGGSATVTEAELLALSERYGGRVGVKGTVESPGVYRLTLVPMDPAQAPAPDPVS